MFKIKDRVHIEQLNCNGRILTIWITKFGTQYEVRYFYNGDAKNVYFYEDEITLIDDKDSNLPEIQNTNPTRKNGF